MFSRLTCFALSVGGGDYWLIDTDYTSYSLVYSCRDIPVPNFPLKLGINQSSVE